MMRSFSQRYIASIDIGSSKLCCWLGEQDSSGNLKVMGAGHVEAKGVWGGSLVNIRALEESLTYGLYEAERQSNFRIRQARVVLNGAFFTPERCVVSVPLEHGIVRAQDIQMLHAKVIRTGQHPAHVIPLEFQVDQQCHIQNPEGVMGKTLHGLLHVLWIDLGKWQSLTACFKRCQLEMTGVLFSAYASAMACLSEDERELGATLVDMGASSTSLAFFSRGKMVSSWALPMGGHHITQDIAQGCETRLDYAERMKILYGAAIATNYDHHESLSMIPLGNVDSEPSSAISRGYLTEIIQARSEEIFATVKKHIPGGPWRQRIVLTGGASQLPGVRELMQRLLECPVKVAKPYTIPGALKHSGEFSAVSGGFLEEGNALGKVEKGSFLGFRKKYDTIKKLIDKLW